MSFGQFPQRVNAPSRRVTKLFGDMSVNLLAQGERITLRRADGRQTNLRNVGKVNVQQRVVMSNWFEVMCEKVFGWSGEIDGFQEDRGQSK